MLKVSPNSLDKAANSPLHWVGVLIKIKFNYSRFEYIFGEF